MNKVLGIAIGAGLFYGMVRLLKMQNVSDVSTMKMVNPRIHSINLGGLTFRTEVEVNNPSRDSIRITKPVVTLTSKNKFLTQSDAENKEIVIQPLAVTKIDTIELELSWSILAGLIKNIVTKIPAVITAWKSGNKKNLVAQLGVPMEMYFTTYVNGLFYQSPSEKLI
ncbi:MAG: hypothetical protein F9K23_10305 [Bacteroidetes bacterium]|nr:MAG: hypothetical protein F9K23_10305 [Bacteroidota bacterium]